MDFKNCCMIHTNTIDGATSIHEIREKYIREMETSNVPKECRTVLFPPSPIFRTAKDAENFLMEKSSSSDFYCGCVKFYDHKSTPKYRKMEQQITDMKVAINALNKAKYVDTLHANYITCRHCGSRLAIRFLYSNTCPLCRFDIRPPSTLDKLKAMREQCEELERRHMQAPKDVANCGVAWLVLTKRLDVMGSKTLQDVTSGTDSDKKPAF